MARKTALPSPDNEIILECLNHHCPNCGQKMWHGYDNDLMVRTLDGMVKLRLKVRRCQNKNCSRSKKPYRPECEGNWALPVHEFGFDVIAYIGALRYQEHRSVTQRHKSLKDKGMIISPRSVSNLLNCGMQPDIGHEVLWVIRDCISQEILLAKTMLSSRGEDLGELLKEVARQLPVPIKGIVSDGQQSIPKAVRETFPDVPHGLCHFHYLREAAKPIYEADRHGKKVLKKGVRGIRAIERSVQKDDLPLNEVILGYCSAVRSAITDDGRPPLCASGLKLRER